MAIRVRKGKFKKLISGRTREKAAQNLGISRAYLQKILADDIPVGSRLVEKLLRNTGQRFDQLFYFENRKEEGSETDIERQNRRRPKKAAEQSVSRQTTS